MKTNFTSRFPTKSFLALLALGAFAGITHAQTTRTWDGGGVAGTNMDTAANWSGDVVPSATTGDTAQWDGSVAGPLSLTYTAAGTGANLAGGNGIYLNILGTQTAPLTINQASGTTAVRVRNITIAEGAGAFTYGSSDATNDAITLGSSSVNAHTFTNNSSNMATFGTDARFAFGGSGAKTITFTGSGNWTLGGKFGNGGGGSVTSVTKTGAGTLTINANIVGTNSSGSPGPGNIFVKSGTMVVDTNGVVTTTAYSSIAQSGTDVGTLTLKGNGSFVSGGDLNVGDVGSSSGTLNIQDTASLSVGTGGGFYVGSANTTGSTASGTVNHSGGTVAVNATADARLVIGGRNSAAGTGGTGTYNLSGTGVLNNAGNAFVGGYGTGTVAQTGGTWNNTGWVSIARQTGGTGSYTISGGALNQTGGGMGIIVGELGTGTLAVSGSGAVTTAATGTLRVGGGAGSIGTVHLDTGGTITTPKVDTAGGTSTFNFNGGTLKANAGGTTFLQGLTTANVRNSGALIDTNGNNITIGQALVHSTLGGDAATDGGLTKSGSGTLTLGGANTYNGPTAITGGALVFAGSSTTGNISLADGATLGAKVTDLNASAVANTNNPGLTLGTAGATNFAFDFNTLGNPTVPIFDLGTGVVTLNGVASISLANTTALTTTPNNTTLALVSFGSQGGAGSWDLTTTSAGHTIFALNPVANALYLNVVANPVTWTGAAGNAWNDDTMESPKNWTLPDTSGTDYINGDTVLFTDTAGTFTVDITENVSPGTVNFSNASNAYTIGSTGGFGITSGSVNLNGGGTVTIANSNSYAGATTINAGTLTVTGSLTASPVTLNAGTLNLDSPTAVGSGGLKLNGGTLDSTAAGTVLAGNPAQNWNGDFAFAGTNDLDLGTGAVTVGGSGDRTVTVAGTLTVGELRTGPGQGLIKQGAGTLVLTSTGAGGASSVVNGVLEVAAGTLQMNRTGTDAAGSGDVTAAGIIGGGTITNGAAGARWLFSNAASGSYDFSGTLANGTGGALGFVKSGASTQILSGSNNYSDPTTVNGGTLVITGTNSTGGAVNINGSAATPAFLNLQNSDALGTGVVTATNRNSGIQLQGGITLPSTVTFVTSNDGIGGTVPYAIANLGGDNTINGTITLTSGGGGSIIQSDAGSLTLAGNISIASGQSSRGITLQGSSTGANTFSGALSDLSTSSKASITKSGTGTWTIAGNNTYTGATTVAAGILAVNGSIASSSGVTVNSGATLQGTGRVATTTVDVGGHVAPGNSIGTLTVSGSMAISGTLDVEYDDSLTQPIDLLNVSGTLDITAATVDFADISSGALGLSEPAYVFATYGTLTGSQFASVVDLPTGYSINYAYAGNNIALVPEPTAALLAGLGVLALLRRRRHS